MTNTQSHSLSKVPEVTLGFWIIKIIATTLGEVGGNAVTMQLGFGYLIGSAMFAAVLIVLVGAQIMAKRFQPFLYWAVIVATTLTGTTLADFFDRSLGIGYLGGSLSLFSLVIATIGLWYWALGSVAVQTVVSPKVEAFYWITIMFSQTLGTALGDWMADDTGLGYNGSAICARSSRRVERLQSHCFRQGELEPTPKRWRERAAASVASMVRHLRADGRTRAAPQTWIAPRGNLASSILEVMDVSPAVAATLGFAAGVALEAALRRVSVEASLRSAGSGRLGFSSKWPNDVLAGDKKLAGILLEAEAVAGGRLAVVVGIGTNVVAAPEGTPTLQRRCPRLASISVRKTCSQRSRITGRNSAVSGTRAAGLGKSANCCVADRAAGLGQAVAVRWAVRA